MEENKRSVQEIRQEIADILGIPVTDNIETIYEHSIQYQLDDHDVDRIAELRRELNEAIERESSESEGRQENTTSTTTAKGDSNLEKLEARISAYESGSTPEKEAEVDELREKVISILDQHGVKDDNGNLRVVENEGGVVEPQFEAEVTEMRNRIREIAAQRTGNLSQRGEDVLPTLRSLREFLKTPEGQKEGAYESEVARLIEENEKRLESINNLQKDTARVQELKAEIETLQQEIAEIEAEVEKNPNYDAESIKRTEKRVSLYHRQNELRGILTRNPMANEDIDTARAAERVGNILGELKAIQQEKDIGQTEHTADPNEAENGNDGKDSEGKGEGEGKDPEGKDEGEGKDPEGKGEGEGKDSRGKGEGEGKDPGGKGEGEGKDSEGKGQGEGKDDVQPKYRVGRVRGALLSFIQKLLGEVKPNGFLGKFLGGVESALLIGAKPEIPKISTKVTTVPKNSKENKEKDSKKPVEEPGKDEEDMELMDSQWVKSHIMDGSISSLKKGDFKYNLVEKSMASLARDIAGKKDEDLQQMVIDENIPQVLSGTENAYNNLLYHKIASTILKNAEHKGIALEDESGEARPIGDIYADLEARYLREKTDKASRDATSKGEEGKSSTKTPTDREK